MQVFISEYLCSGAWRGELPPSLAAEGRAMLMAIVQDFAALSLSTEINVVTTWDSRCGPLPLSTLSVSHPGQGSTGQFTDQPNVAVHVIHSPEQERELFQTLADASDDTLIIAPEFDRILLNRCETLRQRGARLLNSSQAAIQLCSDKLALAAHCEALGIVTIPTVLLSELEQLEKRHFVLDDILDWRPPTSRELSIIVKPRDGAGSCGIQWFPSLPAARYATADLPQDQYIVQPYIAGRSMSVAGFFANDTVQALPLVEQLLSNDRTFRYQGGRICRENQNSPGVQLLEQLRGSGLSGYNGIDFVVPEQAEHVACLVEVNPRLTTSYIGYRRAATPHNLAKLFFPQTSLEPGPGAQMKFADVEFTASGKIRP